MVDSPPSKINSFLQSSGWELFQKSVNRKTRRLSGVLVIRHDIGCGLNYLYCPRPSFEDKARLDSFLKEIRLVAKKEKPVFLKIDPLQNLEISGFYFYSSHSIQPIKTTIIDLKKSEDELLKNMHEKTRYNVRLAERRGVEVNPVRSRSPEATVDPPADRTSNGVKNSQLLIPNSQFDRFWNMLQETAKRDGFHTHERGYYEKLLTARSGRFSNELFFAEYQGKFLAAALVNFYRSPTSIDPVGGVATYLHGASAGERREIMAPHLLHWEIICEAKRRGYEQYDFWGIDEQKWSGLTRFKRGFGGEVIEYPSSVDLVYQPIKYKFYQFSKKLRGAFLGLS